MQVEAHENQAGAGARSLMIFLFRQDYYLEAEVDEAFRWETNLSVYDNHLKFEVEKDQVK